MIEASPARLPAFAWLLGILFFTTASVSADADDLLDLDAHRGKVVVVDFWASWCVPCRRSFPWMNEMQAKYGDDGLIIIGVNMDAEDGAARQFLADYPADFKIVYDREGDLARDFDVVAMPSSYVFDRDGSQVARHLGFKVRNQDEYEALLVETLEK
jgi:cytochrome c biogenesis protein CcmG/thiol:disulfide interchange protein DsbE